MTAPRNGLLPSDYGVQQTVDGPVGVIVPVAAPPCTGQLAFRPVITAVHDPTVPLVQTFASVEYAALWQFASLIP